MAEDCRIIDVKDNLSFKTIFEAINYCAGTNYTGWMKACWPSVFPDNDVRMWFPKLSRIRNGEHMVAVNDFINYLSEDWNEFTFDIVTDAVDEMRYEDKYWGNDLIFAKDSDGDYLFRGLYVRDGEKSSPNHNVSKRIATRVKLIGSPLYLIEPLDSIGTINDPMSPIEVIRRDGTVRFICGRCNTVFNMAKRCPECGQLIDLRGVE